MVSFILSTILNFLTFIVGLLPNSTGLPTGVADAIQRITGLLYSFDFIIPIDLLLTVVQWILAFEISILLYRFTMWIIHLIRGN